MEDEQEQDEEQEEEQDKEQEQQEDSSTVGGIKHGEVEGQAFQGRDGDGGGDGDEARSSKRWEDPAENLDPHGEKKRRREREHTEQMPEAQAEWDPEDLHRHHHHERPHQHEEQDQELGGKHSHHLEHDYRQAQSQERQESRLATAQAQHHDQHDQDQPDRRRHHQHQQHPERDAYQPQQAAAASSSKPLRHERSHRHHHQERGNLRDHREGGANAWGDLIQGVVQGHSSVVRAALHQKSRLSRDLSSPIGGTVLKAAIEGCGRADVVSLLLQSRCNVNGSDVDGQTPLYAAVCNHEKVSPTLTRLLICAKANPNLATADGSTAAEVLRGLTQDPCDTSSEVKQLVEEVAERPTVRIGVVENEEVMGACFADVFNDKVVFFTKSLVGFFSIDQNRITLKQRLSQQRVYSEVKDLFVNPELGTIGVFIEVTSSRGGGDFQNLIVIWPAGQLQEEEPLKISIDMGVAFSDEFSPRISCSTGCGPLAVVGRLSGGKVLCWHFNSACSQLVSEQQLVEKGKLVAISSNGRWIAVSTSTDEVEQVEIWTFRGVRTGSRIACLARRPLCMALTQHQARALHSHVELDAHSESEDNPSSAWLALHEDNDSYEPSIEVLLLNADGSWASAFKVRIESPCRTLRFGHGSSTSILSSHMDGMVILSDLNAGHLRMSHDDARIRSAEASADRSLVVTAVGDTFRVFRPASLVASDERP
mmetsp:Transcript_71862/g.150130  ORF Transcript_71862/g.150130 Transcript_71862/m.150130 type:complete len:707 (+) Transcript_71862:173-2293(+)